MRNGRDQLKRSRSIEEIERVAAEEGEIERVAAEEGDREDRRRSLKGRRRRSSELSRGLSLLLNFFNGIKEEIGLVWVIH